MKNGKLLRGLYYCKVVLLVLLVSLLCSCASTYSEYGQKLYPGADLPVEQIAILTQQSPYARLIRISRINDTPVNEPGLIELLPGNYKVFASYSGGYWSGGKTNVTFYAEAGHVYEIYPVRHTHIGKWYPAIWDITDELNRPEIKSLVEKTNDILRKNRKSEEFDIRGAAASKKRVSEERLPGFGEEIKAVITGSKGTPVEVKYEFDRYYPFIHVKGSDGKKYHIEISQKTGEVLKILGMDVIVGSFWTEQYSAFQPYGSDLAYYEYKSNTYYENKTFKEMPDGEYVEVKDTTMAESSQEAKIILQGTITYPDGSPVVGRTFYLAEVNTKKAGHMGTVLHINKDGSLSSVSAKTDARGYFKAEIHPSDIKGSDISYTLFSYPRNDKKTTPYSILTKKGQSLWFSIRKETEVFDIDRGGGAVFDYNKELDVVSAKDIPFERFVTSLKFFESDYDTPPYGQRTYLRRFESSKTRYINWELNMNHPRPGERIDYDVEAIWRKSGGSIVWQQTIKAHMETDWPRSETSSGWGNRQAGVAWDVGKYTLELFIGGEQVAKGSIVVY